MRNKAYVILSLPVYLLAACSAIPAKVSLLSQEDGSYRSIAIAASEQHSLNDSLGQAKSTCFNRQLRHIVIKTHSRLLGPPLKAAGRRGQPAELAAYVNTPVFPSLSTSNDYETDTQFRCV